MELVPADTSVEAARVQLEIFRRMRPEKRLAMAMSLSDSLRRLAADGVLSRHPHYSPEQVKLAVFKLTLGDDLFRKAYPGVDIQV